MAMLPCLIVVVVAMTASLMIHVSCLTPSSQNTRRDVLQKSSLLLLISSSAGAGNSALAAGDETLTQKEDASVFLGSFSDPNHPEGYRTVELTGTGFAGFQLATIRGKDSPSAENEFELPAMIFDCPGNRAGLARASSGKLCITIDFSPKGGPKDFTGYWDDHGIRFILDGNFWPKQHQLDSKQ